MNKININPHKIYEIKKNIPNKNSSLCTWLTYLSNQHHKNIDMELERVQKVAYQLQLLHPAPIVITVTGTNGKGTTCHIIESILIEAGFKVGVYSSPHLLLYIERVRIQGKMLSEQKFCQVFFDIESNKGTTSLTYFEYSTLTALQLFKQAKLDVVILEVGLGGRLDATNIIDSDIAVITNIALDHISYLGEDREQIGYEKAGIFRSGKNAVIGELEIPNSINLIAKTKQTNLFRYNKDWNFILKNNHWEWHSLDYYYNKLQLPRVPLINAATALAVIECFVKLKYYNSHIISLNNINKGLIKAQLPGRFQIISKTPYIILDVAHNPHAASYLLHQLLKIPRRKNSKIYALVGMLIDKDIKGTLSCFEKYIDKWYLASLNSSRGAKADELAKHVNKSIQFTSVKDAWLKLKTDVTIKDIILVFGSFHTVAQVLDLQKNN